MTASSNRTLRRCFPWRWLWRNRKVIILCFLCFSGVIHPVIACMYVCMVGMKTFTDHRGGLNSSSLRKSTLGFDPLANGSNSPGVGRFNNFEDCRFFFLKQIFRMHAFFFLFQRGVSCGRVRRHRWSERFRIAHTRFIHLYCAQYVYLYCMCVYCIVCLCIRRSVFHWPWSSHHCGGQLQPHRSAQYYHPREQPHHYQ